MKIPKHILNNKENSLIFHLSIFIRNIFIYLLKFCVLLLELWIGRERKMENHFFVYNFHFSIVSTLYRLLYLQWFNPKQSAWRLTLHFLQWYTEVSLHPGKLHCCCNPLPSQWLIPSNSKLFAGWSKLPLRVFRNFQKKREGSNFFP